MLRDDSGVRRAIDAVLSAPGIVGGLRAADELTFQAAMSARPDIGPLVRLVAQTDDELAAIAGIHAVSAVPGPAATSLLADLLFDARWHVSEHAAWALSARRPCRRAIPALVAVVAEGGFAGMLAQRTLGAWAPFAETEIGLALALALADARGHGARRRLTETMGLLDGPAATLSLTAIAGDRTEAAPTRAAAIGALGGRRGDPAVLWRLADGGDEVAEHALLAVLDRLRLDAPLPPSPSARRGLRVVQLFLHADMDHSLDRAGAGDHGGIATLLRLLSSSMASHPDVEEIITIGRGRRADALTGGQPDGGGRERSAGVAFGPTGGVDPRAAWTYRVDIERGLRRILGSAGPIDAIHLRMADVGTLAASIVAREMAIPVVFTAAPDPHVFLRALDADGSLTRANFGEQDALEHYWFRARMVERLTAQAGRVALLPRPELVPELRELLGFELDEHRDRAAVIPEGVHAATVRRAAREVGAARATHVPPGLDALADAISELPVERRQLPLVVTVGRLHPMKGMDRIVAAWATDQQLRTSVNLLVIGGDLDTPSPDELDVLTSIDEIVGPGGADGLMLLGHRPHADVARILAAAASGALSIPAGGIYVGAARKEEFGLAIVEALAAGLAVVAPAGGGPATYVRDGVTGILVDTGSTTALAAGMREALVLAGVPGRMAIARSDVLDHYTIEAMADRLVDLYGSLVTTSA